MLSVGKAAADMARAIERSTAAGVEAGLAIGVGPAPWLPPVVQWMEGSHPLPDERSVEAGRRALDLAARVPRDGRLLVLLSGGASSLMAVPASGIALEEKRETTRRLLLGGADIHGLNAVRKHMSAIKGGRLAAACAAPVLTMAVSDVIGDDLGVIGSGPAVPDLSTFSDALRQLDAFGGRGVYPPGVVALLEAGLRGEAPETAKPGDPSLAGVSAVVIGSRHTAAAGAAAMAESLGYRTLILSDPVLGEARAAGPRFVGEAVREAAGGPAPTCVIGTGETTVRVTGAGLGGRNQELVLSAAGALAGLTRPAALLSGGTDGIDGPTLAAGAICDVETVARARRAGLGAPADALGENDAFHFFEALGDLVVTGPTGTNVGDLVIFLAC